jgi:hypothetical protein
VADQKANQQKASLSRKKLTVFPTQTGKSLLLFAPALFRMAVHFQYLIEQAAYGRRKHRKASDHRGSCQNSGRTTPMGTNPDSEKTAESQQAGWPRLSD